MMNFRAIAAGTIFLISMTVSHFKLLAFVVFLCFGGGLSAALPSNASSEIDALILKDLEKQGQSPNEPATETQFLRRVYLDVIGRIPTKEEQQSYFLSDEKTRRARLIDELLASGGHVSHMYNWLGDMLRVKDSYYRVGSTYTFQTWLKTQLRENRPWDELVHDMLTAEGRIGENGATAYLLRDASMPLDSLSNTMTTFLGANVSCAQCHDHPFAEWTQRDFYELAAFFGTTAFERVDTRKPSKSMADKRFSKANLVGLLQPNMERVAYEQGRKTVFPDDYAYSDAEPGETVVPKFIKWDHAAKTTSVKRNPQSLRKQFANWMTSPENPRFAAAISNRLWKRSFGLALKEPVTDLDVLEDATNPELLKYLAKLMTDVEFDLREFQRAIMNSQTYQQQVSLTPPEGEEFHFNGPLLRRMTAEQIWDSVALLHSGSQIDQMQIDKAPVMERLMFPANIALDRKGVEKDKEKVFAFGKTLLTDEQYKNATSGGRGLFVSSGKKKRGADEWLRASELTQPMAPTHFLRVAGQSAREVADDGSTEGGITESLAFMNGKITDSVMGRTSSVMKKLNRIKSNDAKVTFLYATFLARQPTVQELGRSASALEEGLSPRDIVWALLNSREFIFIQ